MFNIIPLILILVSIGIIIVIVAKKFSVLANLDVGSIPAEREARFKEKILSNRLKRNFVRYYSRTARVVKPVGSAFGSLIKMAYDKLVDLKEESAEEEAPEEDDGQSVRKLFLEAEELAGEGNYDEAEKKYIAIIGADSRNIAAFKELGRLYYNRKDFNEARQTLEHALRLAEKNGVPYDDEGDEDNTGVSGRLAGIYFDLALICRAMEEFENAQKYLSSSLDLEPNNPRYLDTQLEMSIINKDKFSALDALKRLEEANPENHKLPEFKKQINEL